MAAREQASHGAAPPAARTGPPRPELRLHVAAEALPVSSLPRRAPSNSSSDNDNSSDTESNAERTCSSRSRSSSSSSTSEEPMEAPTTPFRALRSPLAAQSVGPGRQRGSNRGSDSSSFKPISSAQTALEAPFVSADSAGRTRFSSAVSRPLSVSSAGHTHGSRRSEAGSDRAPRCVQHNRRRWRRASNESALSSALSYTSSGGEAAPGPAPCSCGPDKHGAAGRFQSSRLQSGPLGNGVLPSSNYYVDKNGQLRVRKLWWCYTRARRALWFLVPWLKRDSNTFLCARMLANSLLIVGIYFLRLLLDHFVIAAIVSHEDTDDSSGSSSADKSHCHQFSLDFLDMFVYTLVGNVLLCLPALNFKACRLYRRAAQDGVASATASVASHGAPGAVVTPSAATDEAAADEIRFEKTTLFTLCEFIVVLEIPYLVYTLVRLFLPATGSDVPEAAAMLAACARELAPGYFLVLLGVQLIALLAYLLRWRQILLFHRLHQHFLFQRGYVPGHSRFDYVERSFAMPLYAWLPAPVLLFWRRFQRRHPTATTTASKAKSGSNAKRETQRIKVALYGAAKRGDVELVRQLLDEAVACGGPEFATTWYEPRVWRLGSLLLLASGQRNPLHVAVAFDQLEVARELLANGHFDVQQLDKLELLRLDLAWLYRLMFRLLFFVFQRPSGGGVAATSGAGSSSGGTAPGLASAAHPFGPVGLLQATLLTPLHVAVTLGHAELTLLLLRYGAQPDLPALSTHPRFATAPLFWAVDKDCTRLLLDADANPLVLPSGDGGGGGLLLTAFEVARLAGNTAVARQMERYGGDVALTPLHDACAGGRRREVAFLLEHGAEPDTLGEQVTGCFRRTPLHWAAMRGHARVLRVLLRYGANVDARDVFGRTPLAWACVLNRASAVETLLAAGADVNVRDAQGDPLLCICAAGACAAISTGPSASKRNKEDGDEDGEEDEELAGLLSGRRSLARGLDPRIFQLLLDRGVDLLATRASNGDSALHVALRRRNQAAALLFVRAGLSLTATNFLGQRALECARSPALRFAVKKEAGHRDVMISYCHAHAPLARKLRDALERARVTTWIDAMGPTGITGGAVWRQEIARGIQSSALVLAVLTQDYPQSQWCMKELAFAKMQNVPVVAIQCEDMEISEELQVYLWTRQVIDFRPAVKQTHYVNIDAIPKQLQASTDVSGSVERPRTASNSSHAMDTGDHREDESSFQREVSSMKLDGDDEVEDKPTGPPRVTSDLELVPDYNDEAFRHCMRLLLDGIQDQIEEHRIRLARREAQQHMNLPGTGGRSGYARPRHGRRAQEENVDAIPVDECVDEDLSDGAGQEELEDDRSDVSDDARNSVACPPALVPADGEQIRRPLRRLESVASSLASSVVSSAENSHSFVFIAHGDYHRSFCLRVQKALNKQGIRCVVDQAIPAVHYGPQGADASETSAAGDQAQANGFSADPSGGDQQMQRLSVQTRQLAAKDAILACSAVLVVLSPLSANCDLLADQLAFAEDRGKLLVPVLLSLHNVDLAKRYTFSRSLVHHFNNSLGFEQSAQQLGTYLRAQQRAAARQRRMEHRQLQQADHAPAQDSLAVLASPASPTSSVSSEQSRPSSLPPYSAVVEVNSPFDDEVLYSTDPSLLLPTLPVRSYWASMPPPASATPIATTPVAGSVTSTSANGGGSSPSRHGGHGWSETDVMETSRRDEAQLFQQDHLHQQQQHTHHQHRSHRHEGSPSRRTGSAASSNSSTGSTGSSAQLIPPPAAPRHENDGSSGSTDEIV